MINEMQDYYDKGNSIRDVSKKFNITIYKVRNILVIRKKKVFKNDDERKDAETKKVISWRQRTKLKLIEYKGGKCQIKSCGYNKSVWSLGFHHINPNEKDFSISGKTASLDKLMKEVDKCLLICNNCHGEIHEEIGKNGYSDIVNRTLNNI